MNAGKPVAFRLAILGLKLLILAILVWFVYGFLAKAWHQLQERPLSIDWRWLVATGALYIVGLLPAGLYWWWTLRVLGQDARVFETLRAYLIGHLGKYVPGKAMVIVLRAGLLYGRDVHPGVATAGVFIEGMTMTAVGAAIAGVILALRIDEVTYHFIAVGTILASVLPILPPVLRWGLEVSGIKRRFPAMAENLGRLRYSTLLVGWLAMLVVWFMLALSQWATFCAIGLDQFHPLARIGDFLGAVTLSFVAGAMSMLPGGLGVRDILLAALLKTLFEIDELDATVASVLLRVVWLVAELIVSAILYVLPVRRNVVPIAPPEIPPNSLP